MLVVITAAGYKQFGEAYWNLWDFYSSILDNYWSPGARTLVFLAAGIQAFATFVTNLTSNSIPVVCFLLAWVCVPWKLTYSATSFITFLGSYLCFICPIVAIMVVDYFLIRKGNIHIPSLYATESGKPYYYTHGFNLRAFISWAAAIALVIPGVSGALSPGSIGTAAVRIYDLGFLLSTSMAALLYYTACRIWPVQIYPAEHVDADKSWEAMRFTEGFFGDEDVVLAYLVQTTLLEERTVSAGKSD
ncbi:uncharacterized protein DSM5745_02713 [Aspergillus mulundensis]|uniref:Allantoin permease n=1 Tax=Aspergillus mulundensis TaxID=1810919 RepID=A0A3D8SIR7_9EURO|nr:hypothetical protein DSM5745_02713 [Aspergillus mulundensis]RDW86071.1 hypothetical protein DSM5745_02713 [Aspergillus mulundensis]